MVVKSIFQVFFENLKNLPFSTILQFSKSLFLPLTVAKTLRVLQPSYIFLSSTIF